MLFWAVFTWFHLSILNTYLLYLNQVKYGINPLLTLRYKIALYRSVVLIDLHFIFLWVNNRLWYRNLLTSDVSSLKIETNMVHTRHSKFYFFFYAKLSFFEWFSNTSLKNGCQIYFFYISGKYRVWSSNIFKMHWYLHIISMHLVIFRNVLHLLLDCVNPLINTRLIE